MLDMRGEGITRINATMAIKLWQTLANHPAR